MRKFATQLAFGFLLLPVAALGTPIVLPSPPLPHPLPPVGLRVSVDQNRAARPLAKSFIGLSFAAGWINEVYVCPGLNGQPNVSTQRLQVAAQLLRNIAEQSGAPPLRSIGDQTQWSPSASTTAQCSATVNPQSFTSAYGTLGPQWINAVSSLAQSNGSPMIIGLNLAEATPGPADPAANAKNTIAFAQALQSSIPTQLSRVYELGNEPDDYASEAPFAGGAPADCTSNTLRICGYDSNPISAPAGGSSYISEFGGVAAQLATALGVTKNLAGPTTQGGFQVAPYFGDILQSNAAYLALVTNHRYGLDASAEAGKAIKGVITDLLLDANDNKEAGELYTLNRVALTANSAGLPIRLDETNSFDAGGAAGVLSATCTPANEAARTSGCVYASQTFASALWAVDWIFQVANQGYAGVNFQAHGNYTPFDFYEASGHEQTQPMVAPIYYGMLLAAQALHGSPSLLPMTDNPATTCANASDAPSCFQTTQALRVWGVRDEFSGELRFVVLNKGPSAQSVELDLPVVTQSAMVERLQPPASPGEAYSGNAQATQGITIGGLTFDHSTDGLPTGHRVTERLWSAGNKLVVPLGGYSAAMIVVQTKPQLGAR